MLIWVEFFKPQFDQNTHTKTLKKRKMKRDVGGVGGCYLFTYFFEGGVWFGNFWGGEKFLGEIEKFSGS